MSTAKINERVGVCWANVLAILFASAFALGGVVPASWADDPPATYTNPLFPKNFPDPFVVARNGTFFAYATAQTSTAGFQLLESTDLVKWTPRALEFPIPWATEHYWAPEVAERNGTYYLTYSALDPKTRKHDIAVATATSPGGPFTHRAKLVKGDDNKVGVIDATIAVEGDGSAFLIYSEETPRRVVMRSLNPDWLGTGDKVTELLRPDLDWEHGVTEAPTVLKRRGVYHLFYSAGPYEGTKDGAGYSVGHAHAKTLAGPYTKTREPLLKTVEGKVYGPGHQCVVTTPDGRDWCVYHAWDAQGEPRYGKNRAGRTMRLDPIVWDGNTPSIPGPSVTPQPAPVPR